MNSDAESLVPPPEQPDIWRLPEVIDVEIRRASYRPPRRHMVSGRVIEMSEGIEILVRTDAEIPIRALSTALFVGGIQIAENQQEDPRLLRFFVAGEPLDDGAPITLGWVDQPPPRAEARFFYQPPDPGFPQAD